MMAGAAPQTLLDRRTLQEKWLAARLEGIRAIKPALTILVGTLSDEQRKMADELRAPHMGMMATMSAMSGQMGPRVERTCRASGDTSVFDLNATADERLTTRLLPSRNSPWQQSHSFRHCYSMRRHYRARAAKPRQLPINCKRGRLT
jgi:hypothetical protein